jgi:predicted nucleic acid-binding protein
VRSQTADEPLTACEAALVHDPDAFQRPFPYREDKDLPFDGTAMPSDCPVMLDTNVTIARLQGKLPSAVAAFVEASVVIHSSVALSEISISACILDPSNPATEANRSPLLRLLEAIRLSDCRSPSPAAWVEAGTLSGILARVHHGLAKSRQELSAVERCCQKGRRRELLNDALLFLSAREQGAILVSSNVSDVDVLLRFRPDARVLLFRA